MFFKSIAQAFVDFNELYPCGPLQLVVEHLNSKKTLPLDVRAILILQRRATSSVAWRESTRLRN